MKFSRFLALSSTRWLIHCILAYIVIYFYIDLSGRWTVTGNGILKFNILIYLAEIPLAVMVSCLFYFPRINHLAVRELFSIMPVLILYGLFDTFYNFYTRAPRPSDLDNFTSIFEFSPLFASGLLVAGLVVPACFLVAALCLRGATTKHEFNRLIRNRLLLLLTFGLFLNSSYFFSLQQFYFNYVVWAEEDTIRENGKFNSYLYYYHQEKNNRSNLESIKASKETLDVSSELFPGKVERAKNIHLIVLESFIDPRLIKGLKFNRSPVADELLPYLDSGEFSHVLSPIYGGGTAQAEFELLTGVQALGKVNQIEFNVMKGGEVNGFVNKLKQNCYQAVATIAAGKGFFNSIDAYQSLGFEKITYLQDVEKFKQAYKDGFIFDGDLLDYNLLKVTSLLNTNEKPIFNYVLGMYGHMPFPRELEKRPDVIQVLTHDVEPKLERIANQFYYRTKAIAKYIQSLKAIDPSSIVYVTSDHLPAILSSDINYRYDNKTNISLLLNGFQGIAVSNRRYYELPPIMWALLNQESVELANAKIQNWQSVEELYGAKKSIESSSMMEKYYYQLLIESLEREETPN